MIQSTVYTIHSPDEAKLALVKSEMAALGAPTIRAVDCGDYLMALEGCHRIAAAHEMGIVPDFVIVGQDDMIDISGFDWFDPAKFAATDYPAGEIAGELFSVQARVYQF